MAHIQSDVNHQKELPKIPFEYHPAYDDRYRGVAISAVERDTYFTNEEQLTEYSQHEPSESSENNLGQEDMMDNDYSDKEDDSDETYSELESPLKQQQTNGDRLPSPPPSLPTEEDDDCDEEIRNVMAKAKASMLSQQRKSKVLPSIPSHVTDTQQSYVQQQQPPLSPAHQKRKKYFNLGKSLTSRLVTNAPKYKLFKKSHAKDNDNNTARRYIISNPIPIVPETPKASLLSELPTLTPSSPISHQLPSEYFPHDFKNEEEDNRSATLTTPDLTIDDLYHLVLNMQKGFQLQMNEMNTQILELKTEIRRLKGEESENEALEDEEEEFTVQSVSGTASSVRSVTRQMERYGGSGKWFHNEYI